MVMGMLVPLLIFEFVSRQKVVPYAIFLVRGALKPGKSLWRSTWTTSFLFKSMSLRSGGGSGSLSTTGLGAVGGLLGIWNTRGMTAQLTVHVLGENGRSSSNCR